MIKKNSIKILMIISIFFIFSFSLISTVSAATIELKATDSGGINSGINSASNGDTISLAPGKYTGANNKGINIAKTLTISGKGSANSVVIDAQKTNSFFSISTNANVIFRNITFINGNNPSITKYGNILINSGSTATFINCRFIDNSAYLGAVIYNKGTCKISNSIFSNNSAALDGAINNVEGGKLTVTNSNFTNNKVTVYGGAITNYKAYLEVTNSIFTNTIGTNSGGIYNDEGSATLKNNIIKNNKFAGILNTGTIIVADNTLFGNPYGNFLSNGTVKDQSRLITYLSLAKFQASYGKKTTFKATLKNNLKKVMKNQYISFYANDKYLGKVKTNSNGVATLTNKVAQKGKVVFKATFGGTKTYRNAIITKTMTVK